MKASQPDISKAQGDLIDQLAGDALGGLVNFRTPGHIIRLYSQDGRDMADDGQHPLSGKTLEQLKFKFALWTRAATGVVEPGVF